MKLHIGCGWRNFGSDWIHIDAGNYSHTENHDIVSLPYKNNSVDLIYASHVIEYFDRESVLDALLEWGRVLKPKGKLRIAVPNFKAMCELYVDGSVELLEILGPLYGKMMMGDDIIYHKTVYDFPDLKETLLTCGFNNVTQYDWRETEHSEFDDHSQAYIPHMDKENGTLISLNVEATK
mgnify:CR=1 FL=1|tara:strand:+ start:236 stop:772 length:537 start_codon:yes stop_codon:yes gene_type:complete